MTRKSTSSSSSRPWKELWNDRHYRLVPRNSDGTFAGAIKYSSAKLQEKVEGPSLSWGSGEAWTYTVKVRVEGQKKPFIALPTCNKKLYAPAGSKNRELIYAEATKMVEKYNLKVINRRLKSTFDAGTGRRVEW